MADILALANTILVDFDGNRAYLTDDKLYIYDSTNLEVVWSFIKHNDSDLGEPSIDKHLNGIDVDYVGDMSITVYLDNVYAWTFAIPYSATRTTVWMHYPITERLPFQKLFTSVVTATPGTKVYGIEIDFNTTKRRRSG
jgi:hypothetical protein